MKTTRILVSTAIVLATAGAAGFSFAQSNAVNTTSGGVTTDKAVTERNTTNEQNRPIDGTARSTEPMNRSSDNMNRNSDGTMNRSTDGTNSDGRAISKSRSTRSSRETMDTERVAKADRN